MKCRWAVYLLIFAFFLNVLYVPVSVPVSAEEITEDPEATQEAEAPVLGKVTGLKASPAGKNRVRLTWTAVPGAEGYLVYAQKSGNYGYVGMTTSGTTFTDTKALDNDWNYYWVFAYVTNASGKMLPGGCEKYVYQKGICPAVTNLKASSGYGGVGLTWNKVDTAEGYLIYGKTSSGAYGYKGMTTGTVWVDRGASWEEYNFYWVFPYHKNSSGEMIPGNASKYVFGKKKFNFSASVNFTRLDYSVSTSHASLETYYDLGKIGASCEFADIINDQLYKRFKNTYHFFGTSAASRREAADAAPFAGANLYDRVIANVTYNAASFLSISFTEEWWMGGVSNTVYSGITFNLNNGKICTPADVLGISESEARSKLYTACSQYISAHPDDFLPNALEILSEWKLEDYPFLIGSDRQILVCMQPYVLTYNNYGYFYTGLYIDGPAG